MESDNPCNGCSLCCRYVAMEIDKPENQKDFDQIKWFLVHKDVWIFIDHDNSWNIQFNTPCEKLEENLCGIYETRPRICQDYSSENCEKYGEGNSFKLLWKNMAEFEEYLLGSSKYSKFALR
jgi:Fe-S-cluster containining protein